VLLGTALKNKGIQPLMDAVTHYLPSPADRSPVEAQVTGSSSGKSVVRGPTKKDPFCALAFKVGRHPPMSADWIPTDAALIALVS
jgi:elongation factor G